MPVKTEIIQCGTCEGHSFQIHRVGGVIRFVCITCGEKPLIRCPVCEFVEGHSVTCPAHSATDTASRGKRQEEKR